MTKSTTVHDDQQKSKMRISVNPFLLLLVILTACLASFQLGRVVKPLWKSPNHQCSDEVSNSTNTSLEDVAIDPRHLEALSKLPTWQTAVNNEDYGNRQRRMTEAATQRYEELLIYPALLAHPNPQVIIIVGATSLDLARRQITERWPTSTTTVLTFLGDTAQASDPYQDEISLQRLNALRTEENRTVDVVILDVKTQFLDNRCPHDEEEGLTDSGDGYCNP
jgi:hypothetical protein